MGDCCQEKLNIPVQQIDHFMQTVPMPRRTITNQAVHVSILRYHHS